MLVRSVSTYPSDSMLTMRMTSTKYLMLQGSSSGGVACGIHL